MEYNNTYIDTGEIPQLEDDQSSSGGSSSQYMHAETGVSELGNVSESLHHPIVDEEELLAAQEAADAAVAQQQQNGTPGGVFSNVAQGLAGKNRDVMMQYWQETINAIEHDEHDFKNHQLPLARIKKVMKTDEDVRMISAEAPILFAKGCDIFITELTMRAWIHAEENKRRTLQKSDIAAALTKSDMFDFLIDVVPREEEKPKKSYPTRTDNFNAHPTPSSSLHMLNGAQAHLPNMRVPPSSSIPHIPSTAAASTTGHLPSQVSTSLTHTASPLSHSGAPSFGTAPSAYSRASAPVSSTQDNGQLQTSSHSQSLHLQETLPEHAASVAPSFVSEGVQKEIVSHVNEESGPDPVNETDATNEGSQSIKADGAYYENFTTYENNF